MIGPGVSLNHHHDGRYWQLVGVGPDAEMRSRKTPDWGDDSQAMFFLAWRCRFAAGRDTTSQTWGQHRTPHQTPTPTTRPVSQLGCRLFCQISNALQEAVSSSVPPWWRFSYQHSRASHLDPSRRCRDLEVLEEGLEPHLIQGCHSDQSAPTSTMPLSVSLSTTPVGDFLTLRGSSRLSTHSRDPTAVDTLVNPNCHGGFCPERGWSRTNCDIGRLDNLRGRPNPRVASGIPPGNGTPNPPKLTCTPAQPSPSLIKIAAVDQKIPNGRLVPKGSPKSMPLLSPASLLPQARSVRQSHVVNGILFVAWVVGRGSGWTSPNLHECCRQAFLRQSETAGEVKCHWVCSKMCLSGVETRRVSRPLTTKGGMASLAAMKLLMPQDKLTKLARRAGRERRSVLISAAGITTPPPPTPPSSPCSLTIGVWEAPATGVRDKNL